MQTKIDIYVFHDPHFAPDGDTLVCIAERAKIESYLPKKELAWAFSGHAVYRGWPFKTYVGVWGRKNSSRFRRFLRERGAALNICSEEPPRFKLAYFTTANERRRVRHLEGRQAPDQVRGEN